MKKNTGLFFILCFIFSASVFSQSITFLQDDTIPVVVSGNTLNNAWTGGIDFPLFSEIDLNGDGIQDLFMFERNNDRICTFINDGSPGVLAWHYAPQYASRFPPIRDWAFLYDYNCDGKMDFFTLSPGHSGISVYRNDFDALNGLHFTLVTAQLNEQYFSITTNVFASSVQIPTFSDVDNDGDMDILGFNSVTDGRVMYHRNYSVEHGHGCDSLDFKLEDQHWGKFIIAGGGGNGHVGCFNCRLRNPNGKDSFEDYDQSTAAPRDDSYFSIFVIDIDDDGDKDLLVGDGGASNTLLVVNGGSPDSALMDSQDTIFPRYDVPATMCNFHFHAYIDVDNDGVKDLLVESGEPPGEENQHGILFYKNTGTNNLPHFSFQSSSFLMNQMIDVGEGPAPVLFDADGDGLKDIVIGNYGIFDCNSGMYVNSLYLYKNTGTLTSPSFQLVDTDYAGLSSLSFVGGISVAFGDLDNDGDQDMLVGDYNGKLRYFDNSGGSGPAHFIQAIQFYMSIDVGGESTPQLVDLNHDGLLDLVIGEKNGFLNYYQNTGLPTAPFFASTPTKDTLGGINLQTPGYVDGYTVPYFFIDHGQYNLLVSCMKGDVYLYNNIDGNLMGHFNLVDTVISGSEGVRYSNNISVSGGDLNNDSVTDMLLGIYTGGVKIYLGNNSGNTVQPPNDSMCNAIGLTLNGAAAQGNNTFATLQEGLSDSIVTALGYNCSTPNNTVWYYYTPATNDSFYVSYSSNGTFEGMLGVFTSSNSATPCSGTLSYVACLAGPVSLGGPATVVIPFAGSAGTTYLFMIDGAGGTVGPYSLKISSISPVYIKDNPKIPMPDFSIIPNPVNDQCWIQINNLSASNKNQLLIRNDLGQVVFSKMISSERVVVNTGVLSAGVYTVQLKSPETLITKKLMIQH